MLLLLTTWCGFSLRSPSRPSFRSSLSFPFDLEAPVAPDSVSDPELAEALALATTDGRSSESSPVFGLLTREVRERVPVAPDFLSSSSVHSVVFQVSQLKLIELDVYDF